jgi:hypothetical protein
LLPNTATSVPLHSNHDFYEDWNLAGFDDEKHIQPVDNAQPSA